MSTEPHRHGRRGERGSVLMLMPAGVLIVLLLGSIAVDFSIVFMAERELLSAATAAANDAATIAVDEDLLRTTGRFQLVAAEVEQAVEQSLAAQSNRLLDEATWDVEIVDGEVQVTIVGRAPYVFAKAIPGAPDHAEVTATARAEVVLR